MHRSEEWPDLEALLISRLGEELQPHLDPDGSNGLGVSTDLPADLGERWFVRLRVISGADDGLTETSRVDVDTYTSDRGLSHDVAAQIRDWLEDLGGTAREDGTGLIDYVRTTQRPVWIDYRNSKIQCFQGTYQVSVRQQ